jgi:membrane associated rhomboid family serine protease
MAKRSSVDFTLDVLVFPLLFVFSLWLVFWIEVRTGVSFNRYGIYPGEWWGLRGVLLGPFIHSGLSHLFNNSVPLLVLTMGLFYFYRSIRWRVLLLGILLTGLLTWLIGRPANHIGASGVIYMLTAFLFFKGLLSRQYQLVALAMAVVFLYGSLLWYIFPIDPKISWEGHLSGFAVGLLFALVFRAQQLPKRTYSWEAPDYDPDADEFMQQFDEDGNFIGDRIEEQETSDTDSAEKGASFSIKYEFKRSKGPSSS